VFNAGTDAAVHGVEVLLPALQFAADAGLAVGDDRIRVALVGAVGHDMPP
jgi:hypothetical protein